MIREFLERRRKEKRLDYLKNLPKQNVRYDETKTSIIIMMPKEDSIVIKAIPDFEKRVVTVSGDSIIKNPEIMASVWKALWEVPICSTNAADDDVHATVATNIHAATDLTFGDFKIFANPTWISYALEMMMPVE